MRFRTQLLAVIISLLILAAISAKAGTDPNTPDTVYVDSVFSNSSSAAVTVRFRNDEPLAGVQVTLKHNVNPSLIILDSVSFTGSRLAYIAVKNVTNHPADTAFTISAFPFSEPLVPVGSGLLCRLHFSFSGALDSTLVTIDSATVLNFDVQWSTEFSDSTSNSFVPQFKSGHLYINSSICCIGNRGNVDGDPNDLMSIVDLNFMINRLFRGGPLPPCPQEANVNSSPDELMTILDLNFLINRFFRGGPLPGPCP